jgi:hypothetical protein
LPGVGIADPDLVERVGDAVKQVSDTRKVTWMANAAALAAYRSGDFRSSGQLAEVADKSSVTTWESVKDNAVALAQAIQCLSTAAAGRTEDARMMLGTLLASQNGLVRAPDGSVVGLMVLDSNDGLKTDVLITQLLITEANDLLDSLHEREPAETR